MIFRSRNQLKRALEDLVNYHSAFLKAEQQISNLNIELDALAIRLVDLQTENATLIGENEALAAELTAIKSKPRRRPKTDVGDQTPGWASEIKQPPGGQALIQRLG